MNLIDFVFRLGVLFAIYGFLWGLIEIGIFVLAGGRQRSLSETYLFRAIKYFILVDVTFLFCLERDDSSLVMSQVIFAGLILLTYFIGKLQQNQNRSAVFRIIRSNLPTSSATFNMRVELIVIALAIALFFSFWFYPQLAINPLSNWFHESIINIEDTPVFGFIFKVIGFFFLLSLFFKMVNAFNYIISGGPQPGGPFNRSSQERSEDDFDDYEEIS